MEVTVKVAPVNPLLAAALEYLTLGWSVIPLVPPDDPNAAPEARGKRPLRSWAAFMDRLPKEGELRQSWAERPKANVGICMGPVSGLIGIDVDGQAGEARLAQLSGGNLPETLEFTTGAGRRLLYAIDRAEVVATRSLKEQGKEAVRILARGSQTVAPPSMHPSGREYRWSPGRGPKDRAAATCPEWVYRLMAEGGKEPTICPRPTQPASPTDDRIQRATAYLNACQPAVSGQGGHDQTFKVCCKLIHGFHLSEDEAIRLMMDKYNPRCEPPWTFKEIDHKVHQAILKGSGPDLMGAARPEKPPVAPKKPEQKAPPNPATAAPPPAPKVVVKAVSEIVARPVEWLWEGVLPKGKIVLLDGDPGLGKSTLLLDIAARISQGGPMPDGDFVPAGNVLVLSGEDGEEDTVKPRLEAAEARQDRVRCISAISDKDGRRPVTLPGDLCWLRDEMSRAALLIVDPLLAYLEKLDKDSEIRKAMMEIKEAAEATGCTVIGLRHLNKGSGQKALYRGSGHLAFAAAARAVFIVGEDPNDRESRVLAVSKCNLARKPDSLKYRLEPVPSGVCRIRWCGKVALTADDLVSVPLTEEEKEDREDAHSKQELAVELLDKLLADGPREIKWCKAEAAKVNISVRTLERAAKELKVKLTHVRQDGENKYQWSTCRALENEANGRKSEGESYE